MLAWAAAWAVAAWAVAAWVAAAWVAAAWAVAWHILLKAATTAHSHNSHTSAYSHAHSTEDLRDPRQRDTCCCAPKVHES
eukprot:4198821-Prymnesium_polylepis.1